jgi:hypothetical protein
MGCLRALPLQNVRDALVDERENLFKVFSEIDFLTPYPSHANFILCRQVPLYINCVDGSMYLCKGVERIILDYL